MNSHLKNTFLFYLVVYSTDEIIYTHTIEGIAVYYSLNISSAHLCELFEKNFTRSAVTNIDK